MGLWIALGAVAALALILIVLGLMFRETEPRIKGGLVMSESEEKQLTAVNPKRKRVRNG